MSSSLSIPSYQQGFARSASESEYPELWRGLVGAWCPFLGPTGWTLQDVSGWGNHGTLTNMDPATDWIVTDKGWALDFDGVSDAVILHASKAIVSTEPYTIVALIQPEEIGNTRPILSLNNSGWGRFTGVCTRRAWVVDHNEYRFTLTKDFVDLYATSWDFTLGDWYHLAGVFATTTSRTLYVDGLLDGTDTTSDSTTPTASTWLGSDKNAYREYSGTLPLAMLYNRVLASPEIQQLAADPYALFQLRRRVFAVSAAPPVGAIMNQIQTVNLGSDLFDGSLSV